MDESRKLEMEKQGKYTVETFADEVAFMSQENVQRILRSGPDNYPDRWKKLGVRAERLGKRQYIINLDPKADTSEGAWATVETLETVLPDHPIAIYHTLGQEPANIVITATAKGIIGPAPVVDEITASSYVLRPLTTSGQVVLHTPMLPRP